MTCETAMNYKVFGHCYACSNVISICLYRYTQQTYLVSRTTLWHIPTKASCWIVLPQLQPFLRRI
jgi:hypothetical protein